jgi:hypothetical protein
MHSLWSEGRCVQSIARFASSQLQRFAVSAFGDEYCADYNNIDWTAVENDKKRKFGEMLGQGGKTAPAGHTNKKGKTRG